MKRKKEGEKKVEGRLPFELDSVLDESLVTAPAGVPLALELFRWQGEKAGTVEQAPYVLKKELSAGCLPSEKFGANAAWFRLKVLPYHRLSFFKRTALPGEFLAARPKRLCFLVFNVVGKVFRHARQLFLRLGSLFQLTISSWPGSVAGGGMCLAGD